MDVTLDGSNTAVIRDRVGTIQRAVAKSYDNANAVSAAEWKWV